MFPVSLDDYLLFVAIADAGGLAGAARATGSSAPTLSRRMSQLEAQLGKRLFERGARGYELTAEGRQLLTEAEPLRAAQAKLARFARSQSAPLVRIATGPWTAQFIARHLPRLWDDGSQWRPEFLPSAVKLDLARREADIGIRNRPPDQNWLAGRKTTTIRYAAYAAIPNPRGWIATSPDRPMTPSQSWVHRTHPDDILLSSPDPRLALEIVLAGTGQMVLPTFVAAAYPQLHRVSADIDALEHEEWLVCHHTGRHDPHVRAALDGLHALLTDRALR